MESARELKIGFSNIPDRHLGQQFARRIERNLIRQLKGMRPRRLSSHLEAALQNSKAAWQNMLKRRNRIKRRKLRAERLDLGYLLGRDFVCINLHRGVIKLTEASGGSYLCVLQHKSDLAFVVISPFERPVVALARETVQGQRSFRPESALEIA